MLPVIVLEPKKDGLILDLCASPGSKTTQLSSETQGTGTIIANEISMSRLKILASNLERCGAVNTIITRKEGSAFCKRLKKYNTGLQFNRILIDAPCSGEGTLRSSPKTYTMWNIKTIKNLPKIQKKLVSSAIEILKPNGILVYSTCTHAPEENEGVVNSILEEFPNIKLESIKLPIKHREGILKWDDSAKSKEDTAGLINSPIRERRVGDGGGLIKPAKNFSPQLKKCARIYPHDDNTEGFFIAKFRKLK